MEKELLPVINSSGLKKGFSHMKHVITSSNHLAWWVKHIDCCNLGKRITSQLRSQVSIDKLAIICPTIVDIKRIIPKLSLSVYI